MYPRVRLDGCVPLVFLPSQNFHPDLGCGLSNGAWHIYDPRHTFHHICSKGQVSSVLAFVLGITVKWGVWLYLLVWVVRLLGQLA